MGVVYLRWKHARQHAQLSHNITIYSLSLSLPVARSLAREATQSERTQAYFSTFSLSVNERLSDKRKTRPEHVFPGGSSKKHRRIVWVVGE
jgi:hypothetical protein